MPDTTAPTPCLQSRCNDNETGSTNQDQVHGGAQASTAERRSKYAAEILGRISGRLKVLKDSAQNFATEAERDCDAIAFVRLSALRDAYTVAIHMIAEEATLAKTLGGQL